MDHGVCVCQGGSFCTKYTLSFSAFSFCSSSSSSSHFSRTVTCKKQGCKELTLLGHAGTKL